MRSAKAGGLHASTSQDRGIRIRCISAAGARCCFCRHLPASRHACSSMPFADCRCSQRCAGCSCFRTLDSGSQQWATSTAGRCRLRQSIRTTRKESPNQSLHPMSRAVEFQWYSYVFFARLMGVLCVLHRMRHHVGWTHHRELSRFPHRFIVTRETRRFRWVGREAWADSSPLLKPPWRIDVVSERKERRTSRRTQRSITFKFLFHCRFRFARAWASRSRKKIQRRSPLAMRHFGGRAHRRGFGVGRVRGVLHVPVLRSATNRRIRPHR